MNKKLIALSALALSLAVAVPVFAQSTTSTLPSTTTTAARIACLATADQCPRGNVGQRHCDLHPGSLFRVHDARSGSERGLHERRDDRPDPGRHQGSLVRIHRIDEGRFEGVADRTDGRMDHLPRGREGVQGSLERERQRERRFRGRRPVAEGFGCVAEPSPTGRVFVGLTRPSRDGKRKERLLPMPNNRRGAPCSYTWSWWMRYR